MIDIFAIPGIRTTVTLRTYDPPTVDAFGHASETFTDVSLDVAWHSEATRRTLDRLPEADRARSSISVYSNTSIETTHNARPDRVQLNGEWYEVIAAADYTHIGGPYLVEALLIEGAT